MKIKTRKEGAVTIGGDKPERVNKLHTQKVS